MEGQAVFPEETCPIACGFCASQCPAYEINIRRAGTLEMRRRVTEILRKDHQEIIFRLLAPNCQPGGTRSPDTVRWDCLKTLQSEDLLAFQIGATSLVLFECQEDCRLQTVSPWLHRLVDRANATLVTVGLGERIRFATGEINSADPAPDPDDGS